MTGQNAAPAPASILIINAGSSSIKYALYRADNLDALAQAKIEIRDKSGYDAAFQQILDLIPAHNVTGIGHRVVHGGSLYTAPQMIDAKVLADLDALTPLAPLHQPHNLNPVKRILAQHPSLPQVACFDTSFHRTQPRLNQLYALPRKLTDDGIVRYGFHGSSYEYIASVLPQIAPAHAKGRVVVAHLGNGASMCAMKDCKSIATTMGFTPLEGLMMGTRSGTIESGIALHLMEQKGISSASLSDIFQKESGLKGVSGISADMRTLLASPAPEAAEAVDLFCLTAARHIASLSVDFGGLDILVFTAGIGENAAPARAKICGHLAHLGVAADASANNANTLSIHDPQSRVAVYVIKTNEELLMAQHVKANMPSSPPAPHPGAPAP